ncbi:hypothetical protein Droror1_Dr00009939 [Drosera rotundifolia]
MMLPLHKGGKHKLESTIGCCMNAFEGAAISTIHVTPEDVFSYASFEAVGYDLKEVYLDGMVDRVLACFEPSQFSISVHAHVAAEVLEPDCLIDVNGYRHKEGSIEELGEGGSIIYQKFCMADDGYGSPRPTLMCCWMKEVEEKQLLQQVSIET